MTEDTDTVKPEHVIDAVPVERGGSKKPDMTSAQAKAAAKQLPSIDVLRAAMKEDRLNGWSMTKTALDKERLIAKVLGESFPRPILDWIATDEYKSLRDDRQQTTRKAEGRTMRKESAPKVDDADIEKFVRGAVEKDPTLTRSGVVKAFRASGKSASQERIGAIYNRVTDGVKPAKKASPAKKAAPKKAAPAKKAPAKKAPAKKAASAPKKAAAGPKPFKGPIPKPGAAKKTVAARRVASQRVTKRA
jgi:hypothetical protein